MHYALYALTLLISSALLFVVQPMVAKMIQPVLGGTPAVWNTAVVFFQATLLVGYLYAHLSVKWLGTRRQAILHLAVLAIGVAFLPVAFDAPADTTVLEAPTFWLLATLALGVGWPVFAVSTSAPLLQKWFSTVRHWRAADPYHLYAASNAGSILALAAYPLFLEPRLGLRAQSAMWMAAYLVLFACMAVCAALLWRSEPRREDATDAEEPPAAHLEVSWRRRARWVLWAFIPSGMMLAVTTYVTTDVAPVPLLWIPPLAIYLLSFMAAFARHRPVGAKWWTALSAPVLALTCLFLIADVTEPLRLVTAVHFAALFVFSMAFHSLLADDRPHTEDLTEFYLWIAIGGVLGGLFSAIAAPLLFDRLLEWAFLLFAAAVAIPSAMIRQIAVHRAVTVTIAVAGGIAAYLAIPSDITFSNLLLPASILAGISACLAIHPRLHRFSPLVLGGLVALVVVLQTQPSDREVHSDRSFFGTHRVVQTSTGSHHVLYHGTTIHGAQARHDDFRSVPLTYYYYDGPLGQIFDELRRRQQRHPVAAVGLGVGSVITYLQPDQRMDIFEIDPAVYQIASDTELFTYLDDCPGQCQVTIGDGRLQLAAADEDRYELIVLDAYSSAAIPVHLLTRQALQTYFRALRPDGLVAIHISSPYLDLAPPIAAAAHQLGLEVRIQEHRVEEDDPVYNLFVDSSRWMVLATSEAALGELATDERWRELADTDDVAPWTDDYANILDVVMW